MLSSRAAAAGVGEEGGGRIFILSIGEHRPKPCRGARITNNSSAHFMEERSLRDHQYIPNIFRIITGLMYPNAHTSLSIYMNIFISWMQTIVTCCVGRGFGGAFVDHIFVWCVSSVVVFPTVMIPSDDLKADFIQGIRHFRCMDTLTVPCSPIVKRAATSDLSR